MPQPNYSDSSITEYDRIFPVFQYSFYGVYVLGTQKNRLIETVILSSHNICFGWETKIHLNLEAWSYHEQFLFDVLFDVVLSVQLSFIVILLWLELNTNDLVRVKKHPCITHCKPRVLSPLRSLRIRNEVDFVPLAYEAVPIGTYIMHPGYNGGPGWLPYPNMAGQGLHCPSFGHCQRLKLA